MSLPANDTPSTDTSKSPTRTACRRTRSKAARPHKGAEAGTTFAAETITAAATAKTTTTPTPKSPNKGPLTTMRGGRGAEFNNSQEGPYQLANIGGGSSPTCHDTVPTPPRPHTPVGHPKAPLICTGVPGPTHPR
jgi:hypothetical protein